MRGTIFLSLLAFLACKSRNNGEAESQNKDVVIDSDYVRNIVEQEAQLKKVGSDLENTRLFIQHLSFGETTYLVENDKIVKRHCEVKSVNGKLQIITDENGQKKCSARFEFFRFEGRNAQELKAIIMAKIGRDDNSAYVLEQSQRSLKIVTSQLEEFRKLLATPPQNQEDKERQKFLKAAIYDAIFDEFVYATNLYALAKTLGTEKWRDKKRLETVVDKVLRAIQSPDVHVLRSFKATTSGDEDFVEGGILRLIELDYEAAKDAETRKMLKMHRQESLQKY